MDEFKGYVQGNYYLANVEIMGKMYKVKASWILIDMQTISYIFPKNSEVKLSADMITNLIHKK